MNTVLLQQIWEMRKNMCVYDYKSGDSAPSVFEWLSVLSERHLTPSWFLRSKIGDKHPHDLNFQSFCIIWHVSLLYQAIYLEAFEEISWVLAIFLFALHGCYRSRLAPRGSWHISPWLLRLVNWASTLVIGEYVFNRLCISNSLECPSEVSAVNTNCIHRTTPTLAPKPSISTLGTSAPIPAILPVPLVPKPKQCSTERYVDV